MDKYIRVKWCLEYQHIKYIRIQICVQLTPIITIIFLDYYTYSQPFLI